MSHSFQTRTPIDGSILFERTYANLSEIDTVLEQAVESQQSWKKLNLETRIEALQEFVACVEKKETYL